VGDEDVGEVELVLDFVEEVEHLGLDADVEGRHRFIEHDDLGSERERAGDTNSLALSSGELVRIAVAVFGEQTNSGEKVGDAVGGFFLRHAVDAHGLADDVANGNARVERGVGVLEHHLDLATQFAQILSASGGDIALAEHDLPGGGRHEAEQRAAEGGLTATGFADHTKGFVGHQVEGDPADRLNSADLASEHPGADRKLGDEVADAEEGVTRSGAHNAPSVTSRSA
jgi:hypothetical protein